jgi:hypothetical protein
MKPQEENEMVGQQVRPRRAATAPAAVRSRASRRATPTASTLRQKIAPRATMLYWDEDGVLFEDEELTRLAGFRITVD